MITPSYSFYRILDVIPRTFRPLITGQTFIMKTRIDRREPETARYGYRAGRVMKWLKTLGVEFGIEVLQDGPRPICKLIFPGMV